VKIVGHLNVPGRIAASASLLYAKNLYAFVETMVDKTTKTFAINREDELIKATMLADGGRVVHPAFARAAEADAAAPAHSPVEAAEPAPKAKKPAVKKADKPASGGEA
jgi:NAD(P) transhydrogenase subunit alpha